MRRRYSSTLDLSYRHLPVLEQTPSDLLVPTDLDVGSLLKQEHVSGAKSLTHTPALAALAGMSFVHKRHAETRLLAPHWLGGGAACGEGVEKILPKLFSGNIESYPYVAGEKGLWIYNLKGNFEEWIPYKRNEIHFMDRGINFMLGFMRDTMDKSNPNLTQLYAEYIRNNSTTFIGKNTFAEMKKICASFYSSPNKKIYETGGLMYISDTCELIPEKLDAESKSYVEGAGCASYDIGGYLDLEENQAKLKGKHRYFCIWHSHPTGCYPYPSVAVDGTDEQILAYNSDETCNIRTGKKLSKEFSETMGLVFSYAQYSDWHPLEAILSVYRAHLIDRKKHIILDRMDKYRDAPFWGPKDLQAHNQWAIDKSEVPSGVWSINRFYPTGEVSKPGGWATLTEKFFTL